MLSVALCLRSPREGPDPSDPPERTAAVPSPVGRSAPCPGSRLPRRRHPWVQTWADDIGERLQELKAPHED